MRRKLKLPHKCVPLQQLRKRLGAANKVSIILPVYNEAQNLQGLIEALEKLPFDKEVIVVDDHSSDGTADMVKNFSTKYNNVKLLLRARKMGLGSAYKDGLKLTSGNIIVEMDADLSHDPRELPKLVEALGGADVVVGSRHIDGGKILGWKWHRKLINKGATFLARVVLGLEVRDSTSGFRAYKKRIFDHVASMSTFNGFDFQVEAIYIAQKLGFRMAEVPITFHNRRYGRSKLCLKDIVDFAKAILKMRFHEVKI